MNRWRDVMRLPWKSELPRGTRVRRMANGQVAFVYADGTVMTCDRQDHATLLRQAWAAMPPHGSRRRGR